AGFMVAGFDGALDGCCPAPPWKQARMDIDTAIPRQIESPARQDQSVSGNYHGVGLNRFQGLLRSPRFVRKTTVESETARLQDRNAIIECRLFDRAGLEFKTAARRTVGLRQHQGNFMTGVAQM